MSDEWNGLLHSAHALVTAGQPKHAKPRAELFRFVCVRCAESVPKRNGAAAALAPERADVTWRPATRGRDDGNGGGLEAGGGREGGREEIGKRGGHTACATRRAARRCAGEERTLARRGRRTRVEGAQARGHAEGDAATPPTGAMAMATPNAAVEAYRACPHRICSTSVSALSCLR